MKEKSVFLSLYERKNGLNTKETRLFLLPLHHLPKKGAPIH